MQCKMGAINIVDKGCLRTADRIRQTVAPGLKPAPDSQDVDQVVVALVLNRKVPLSSVPSRDQFVECMVGTEALNGGSGLREALIELTRFLQ
jgi:hypothetical protein